MTPEQFEKWKAKKRNEVLIPLGMTPEDFLSLLKKSLHKRLPSENVQRKITTIENFLRREKLKKIMKKLT